MTAQTNLPRNLAAISTFFLAGYAAPAYAQQSQGFALDRFDPSERGSEWFANESLDLRGEGRPAVGIVGDYARKPLVLYGPDGSESKLLVGDQLFVHVGGGIIVANRLRFSFDLPIAAYQSGEQGITDGTTFSPPASTSIGDLRLGADLRLVGEFGDPFTAALGVQVQLPTGKQSDYTSDGKVRVIPRLLGAGEIGLFAYAVRVGLQYRALDETFANSAVGTELLVGAAAGLRLADKKLLIGPELYGSTVVAKSDAAFQKKTTPLELLFGTHYTVGNDFRVGLGVGPGLTRGYGTPEVRALASVEWIPGIVPPPPSDRDGDRVVDPEDACPDVAGVKTDDPKTNGCPPPPSDRDHDGIVDAQDACPDVPGVKTDDPKTNGCPPPADRDKDGIIDAEDACPDTPGVKTDDPKTNGCPPPPSDRDHDGIIDIEDACPDAPGPKNEDPKKNGCPEVRIEAGQIKILQQVKFKTGSADILPVSDSILTAVASILGEHAEIKKVRVEGHTDSRGGAAMNKTLSGRRAASVVNWLERHGVDKARLTSEGFGLTRPIDSNDTEEGRANNRRVEFHIDLREPSPPGQHQK